MAKSKAPHTEIIFSCWRFDAFTKEEWDAAIARIRQNGEWIDRLMVDIDSPIPKELQALGKPILSFPEISMYHCTPWGGFGANPFAKTLADQIRTTAELCSGGALYSEGIYEDVNKIVALEAMRDSSISAEETVLEYCRCYFGEAYASELCKIILGLEKTLNRQTRLADGSVCDFPTGKQQALHRYELLTKQPAQVTRLAARLREPEKQLPEDLKNSWRYRLIRIRALGDETLQQNGRIPNEKTDEIFVELIGLYHAENAYYSVAPVTRAPVLENRGEGV